MIKSLFDEEETDKAAEPKGGAKPSILSISAVDPDPEVPVADADVKPATAETATEADVGETVVPFEIDKPIGTPKTENALDEVEATNPNRKVDSAPDESAEGITIDDSDQSPLELKVSEIEDELAQLLDKEDPKESARPETPKESIRPEAAIPESESVKETGEPAAIAVTHLDTGEKNEVHSKDFEPVSKTASIRNSGLAYSAAIALFGSVAFMLIMGWFADLLLGIQPWGTVVGIVIGAIIGFLQFFRLTSQIINPKPTDFEKVSLMNKVGELEETESEAPEAMRSLQAAPAPVPEPDQPAGANADAKDLTVGAELPVPDEGVKPETDLPEESKPEPVEKA